MGSIAPQYTQKISSISWAKVVVVIVSFVISFGLMYGLFLLFSPPKTILKNESSEVVKESQLAPNKNKLIQPKVPTANCTDTNLKDCTVPNLAPTLRSTTVRFDPNSAPITTSITTVLQQNGMLVDVDQTLPLSVELLTGLMSPSYFDGTKLQIAIASNATIIYEPNQDSLFINPGQGVRGSSDFRLQIRDAKNAISNSAIITIAIDCAPNQQWNEIKKRCETILTAETIRQLAKKICSPTELVFGGTFSCDIELVPNKMYAIKNLITASFDGQTTACNMIEPEIIVPYIWRQSLHCPGISLISKLTRGYISESINLHMDERKIMIKISGIIGECPTSTTQINTPEYTQCRCNDKTKYLDSQTKTCEQINRIVTAPSEEIKSNTESHSDIKPAQIEQSISMACGKNQTLDLSKMICKPCATGQVSDGGECSRCPPQMFFEINLGNCLSCGLSEYPSVDGSSCVICDAQKGNGIPDCQSDCSFLLQNADRACRPCGTNYPSCESSVANLCDSVDTPFTRDNGLPQCPHIPRCDVIAENGVPDCMAVCDNKTCIIAPVCDNILDNGVANCPVILLTDDLLAIQVDAVPFSQLLLAPKLSFVSATVKNTPLNGVVVSNERGISYIPLNVQDDSIQIIVTNRAQQTHEYTIRIIASCPSSQSWNPTLKICGKMVTPELLSDCNLIVISGVSACRFSMITHSTANTWTLPNTGLYTQFIDANNASVFSEPCMIELNQTPAAAILCLSKTQLTAVSDALLIDTQSPTLFSPFSTFICDTIPANQISDCQVYCNQILGDFMPDCRPELCDFEFDNGAIDCPTVFATNQFLISTNVFIPSKPSRPSDIFLTSLFLLLVILYAQLFVFTGGSVKYKTSISLSAPISTVAVKKVIW